MMCKNLFSRLEASLLRPRPRSGALLSSHVDHFPFICNKQRAAFHFISPSSKSIIVPEGGIGAENGRKESGKGTESEKEIWYVV
jgi:hypothetical protein